MFTQKRTETGDPTSGPAAKIRAVLFTFWPMNEINFSSAFISFLSFFFAQLSVQGQGGVCVIFIKMNR